MIIIIIIIYNNNDCATGFYLDDMKLNFMDHTRKTYLKMFCEAFKNDYEIPDSELIEYMFGRDISFTFSDAHAVLAIDDIDRYDKSLTLLRSQYHGHGRSDRDRRKYLDTLFKSPNKNLNREDVGSAITSWNTTWNIALQTPIYPYPINLNGYDFTINTLHISLYDVLLNNTFVYDKNTGSKSEFIDFNWHRKLTVSRNKCIRNQTTLPFYNNDYDLIVAYNDLGLQHLDSKILTMPYGNALNISTAPFYFWQFVKICEKFIDKLQAQLWYIDPVYLEHTIYFYDLWFNHPHFEYKEFLHKLLTWHVNGDKINNTNASNANKNKNKNKKENVFYKRFRVFRYIHFEHYFKDKLIKKYEFCRELKWKMIYSRGHVMSEQQKEDFKQCFEVCIICHDYFKSLECRCGICFFLFVYSHFVIQRYNGQTMMILNHIILVQMLRIWIFGILIMMMKPTQLKIICLNLLIIKEHV